VGAKLIVQLHGIEIWRRPSAVQRHALNSAHLIFCVSRDTRARVLKWSEIAAERVLVLPNTVAEEFRPGDRAKAREAFGLAPNDLVLLTVGRLDGRERYKGQDRVIEQLPTLAAAHPNLVYVISGEGTDRVRLEQLSRRHRVTDRVRFLGHTSPAQLPDLYRAADLFVMPSTGEGFGIVFLEAMACGVPAIGVAEGGASDALCDGELGASPTVGEFPSALASALVADHIDASALSRAVRARFGHDVFIQRVRQVWEISNG
jgi:phosphatidylinositol alpha-1,6-mannosyltransferase